MEEKLPKEEVLIGRLYEQADAEGILIHELNIKDLPFVYISNKSYIECAQIEAGVDNLDDLPLGYWMAHSVPGFGRTRLETIENGLNLYRRLQASPNDPNVLEQAKKAMQLFWLRLVKAGQSSDPESEASYEPNEPQVTKPGLRHPERGPTINKWNGPIEISPEQERRIVSNDIKMREMIYISALGKYLAILAVNTEQNAELKSQAPNLDELADQALLQTYKVLKTASYPPEYQEAHEIVFEQFEYFCRTEKIPLMYVKLEVDRKIQPESVSVLLMEIVGMPGVTPQRTLIINKKENFEFRSIDGIDGHPLTITGTKSLLEELASIEVASEYGYENGRAGPIWASIGRRLE